MAKRLPKDFNISRPQEAGLEVVDPVGAARIDAGQPVDRDYPMHLARFEDAIGGPREVVTVVDAADERRQRAQGFKSHHDLDADQAKAAGKKAPAAAKPKAATKPRNPKPKAPAVPNASEVQ